jgi:hypothetical protein
MVARRPGRAAWRRWAEGEGGEAPSPKQQQQQEGEGEATCTLALHSLHLSRKRENFGSSSSAARKGGKRRALAAAAATSRPLLNTTPRDLIPPLAHTTQTTTTTSTKPRIDLTQPQAPKPPSRRHRVSSAGRACPKAARARERQRSLALHSPVETGNTRSGNKQADNRRHNHHGRGGRGLQPLLQAFDALHPLCARGRHARQRGGGQGRQYGLGVEQPRGE